MEKGTRGEVRGAAKKREKSSMEVERRSGSAWRE